MWQLKKQLVYTSLLVIMKLRFICGETKICSTIKRSYIMNMTVASRDLTKDLLVLKNKAMNSQFGKQRRFRSTVVTGTPFSIHSDLDTKLSFCVLIHCWSFPPIECCQFDAYLGFVIHPPGQHARERPRRSFPTKGGDPRACRPRDDLVVCHGNR